MRQLEDLTAAERAALQEAIRRTLAEHHDWEPWERQELINSATRAFLLTSHAKTVDTTALYQAHSTP